MSLSTVEAAVRGALETVVTDISQKVTEIRPHLEELASIAAQVEQSQLAQAALSAVLSPELEQKLTELIQTFAKEPAPAPAPAPAPEPVPASPPAAPVG